jgi:hypothetical protein
LNHLLPKDRLVSPGISLLISKPAHSPGYDEEAQVIHSIIDDFSAGRVILHHPAG